MVGGPTMAPSARFTRSTGHPERSVTPACRPRQERPDRRDEESVRLADALEDHPYTSDVTDMAELRG